MLVLLEKNQSDRSMDVQSTQMKSQVVRWLRRYLSVLVRSLAAWTV